MEKMKYKFLRLVKGKIKSENGDCIWQIGEWQPKIEDLILCEKGYHCSSEILEALHRVAGEVLAIVETKGSSIKEKGKSCWQNMRITKAYKWTKKDSVALAIYSAELVFKNYEAKYPDDDRPRKAIKALENDTAKNRSAAETAVLSAVEAGRSATEAAWAVGIVAVKKINKWLVEHIKELEVIR